jgi:hypothetical protein
MSDCGHRCCEIPSNSYHTHIGPPSGCPHCAGAVDDGSAEASPVVDAAVSDVAPAGDVPAGDVPAGDVPADAPAGDGSESVVLGRIVADVVARVAPQISGLPDDVELTELVASHALAVYAAGLVDPDVQTLGERERRTVLAARVGLALAFPGGA